MLSAASRRDPSTPRHAAWREACSVRLCAAPPGRGTRLEPPDDSPAQSGLGRRSSQLSSAQQAAARETECRAALQLTGTVSAPGCSSPVRYRLRAAAHRYGTGSGLQLTGTVPAPGWRRKSAAEGTRYAQPAAISLNCRPLGKVLPVAGEAAQNHSPVSTAVSATGRELAGDLARVAL